MASLPRMLVDNPIARAELLHQERGAERRKWRRWPALFGIALGVALLSNVALVLAPVLARWVGMPTNDLREILYGWFGTVTVLLGALIMVHHLSFTSAAIQLASATIAREKRALTWESLLLTGMDARRIVVGKWWATLHTLWYTYRPLFVLRFAVALWMGVSAGTSHVTPFAEMLPLLDVALIGLTTALFPLCYAAFMVALGLVASLLAKQEAAAYRIGSLFQFGAIFLSLCLVLTTFALPFTDADPGVITLVPALFITPLDGGMLALIGMIANTGAAIQFYLLGLLLCMAVYALLTGIVLRAAQAIAVRQHALPPGK